MKGIVVDGGSDVGLRVKGFVCSIVIFSTFLVLFAVGFLDNI